MGEIPAKLMLIINFINKGNAGTQGLLGTLINEIKEGNSKQYHLSGKLMETISRNENNAVTAVKTRTKDTDFLQANEQNPKRALLNVRSKLLIFETIW